MAMLTRLRHLSLTRLTSPPGGYDALAGLRSLERLDMEGVMGGSPACLSCLTSLKALRLYEAWRMAGMEPDPECSSMLEQGLAALTQLTQLVLRLPIAALPQAVTRLTQLHSLAWADPLGAGAPLPDGPWVASLAEVEVPAAVAAGSLQLLGGVPRLGYLGLSPPGLGGGSSEADSEGQQRVELWMVGNRPHWICNRGFHRRVAFSAQPLPCHPILLDFWATYAMWGLDGAPLMDWFTSPNREFTC